MSSSAPTGVVVVPSATDFDDYHEAHDEPPLCESTALMDSMSAAMISFHLFLNNKYELAEERVRPLVDKSMYHALTYNSIKFIKALMTCERAEIDEAMAVCRSTTTLLENMRQKWSVTDSIYSLGGASRKQISNEELHADLCYAETLLLRAGLAFFQDESLASFVRAAFKIRASYQTYKACQKLLENPAVWSGRDERVRSQFEAGVNSGIGIFNLALSVLPARVLRLLEVIGFSGDKELAARSLSSVCTANGTLRAPLAQLFVLFWNLVVCVFIGVGTPDLVLCRRLLGPLTFSYPNGALLLFMNARLHLLSGDVYGAIRHYTKSIASQQTYRQFHHLCFWELMFAHAFLGEWHCSAVYARKLAKESRWSRSIYIYLLGSFIAADRTGTDTKRREETLLVLLGKVDSLRQRIAGKSIPLEKFCARRASRAIRNGDIYFSHYEFMYFMNGMDVMAGQPALLHLALRDIETTWQPISENADANDACLYRFLRGALLRHLGAVFEAEQCFQHVIDQEQQLTDMSYLAPNAWLELGLLRISEQHYQDAEACLSRAIRYRSFALENKLHFRVHGAMEKIREQAEKDKQK